MKTIYVRIAKKGVEKFFRCGEQFTSAWRKLNGVDDATAERLREEQMLEVSDTQPEGFESTAEGGSALQPAAGLSSVEQAIVGIVGTQLDTATLDSIFGEVDKYVALDRRADAELLAIQAAEWEHAKSECARLSGLLEQSVVEAGRLAEENAQLRTQLAALNSPVETQKPAAEGAVSGQPVEGAAVQDAAAPTPEPAGDSTDTTSEAVAPVGFAR